MSGILRWVVSVKPGRCAHFNPECVMLDSVISVTCATFRWIFPHQLFFVRDAAYVEGHQFRAGSYLAYTSGCVIRVDCSSGEVPASSYRMGLYDPKQRRSSPAFLCSWLLFRLCPGCCSDIVEFGRFGLLGVLFVFSFACHFLLRLCGRSTFFC